MAVTPQRLAVYQALVEAHDHPTPEMLHTRVRPEMPSLSLATVYKVLDALERIGLVREVHVFSDVSRFDANLDHHHHLVCVDCKKVLDYYDDDLDALVPPKVRGFVPDSLAIRVLGKCSDCAAKTRRPSGTTTTHHQRRQR